MNSLLLTLLLICLSLPCSATQTQEKRSHGKSITHAKKTRRKAHRHSGNYAHIRGGYYPYPPLSELQKRFNQLREKNRRQHRQMTLEEHYEEIAEMLAMARTKSLMGNKDQAAVLLSDATVEYGKYKQSFAAKGFAVLSMEKQFEDIRIVLGTKETSR